MQQLVNGSDLSNN